METKEIESEKSHSEGQSDKEWLGQMPDSFKVLWNSAREMGVLDENEEGE